MISSGNSSSGLVQKSDLTAFPSTQSGNISVLCCCCQQQPVQQLHNVDAAATDDLKAPLWDPTRSSSKSMAQAFTNIAIIYAHGLNLQSLSVMRPSGCFTMRIDPAFSNSLCPATQLTALSQPPASTPSYSLLVPLCRFAVKSIHKRFIGEYLEPNFVARIQHEVSGGAGKQWPSLKQTAVPLACIGPEGYAAPSLI